jgi:hypothetical protein
MLNAKNEELCGRAFCGEPTRTAAKQKRLHHYIMELMDRVTVGLLDSSSVMRNDKWCPVTMGMPQFLYDVEGIMQKDGEIPPSSVCLPMFPVRDPICWKTHVQIDGLRHKGR